MSHPFNAHFAQLARYNAGAASLPFAATLAHVFNHSTHHRGQITAALTAQGRPCPPLDFAPYLLEAAQP